MKQRIKELAEQAGFWFFDYDVARCELSELKNFEELVRQDEREQISHTYLKLTLEAVLREREACAKLCEGLVGRSYEFDMGRLYSAEAIRQRGEQP